MTATNLTAMFSPDGSQWRNQNEPLDWPEIPDTTVTKIVISTAPSGEDRHAVTLNAPLPRDLAQRFPRLTHLYLWQIADLKSLPELPDGYRDHDYFIAKLCALHPARFALIK